jgi:LPXTG-motif cell wall-anchored protein
MKKTFLVLFFVGVLLTVNSAIAISQEKPKPKKDTVNMDSNAKPTFYYAVEDEKSQKSEGKTSTNIAIIAGIVGALAVIGAASFYLMKKKK